MDKTASGAVTGLAVGVMIGVISTILNSTGLCQLCLITIGGGIFTRSMLTATAPLVWRAVGWLVHLTVSMVLGVILAYIISFTGKDFALLKGTLFGAVVWLLTIGGVSSWAGYLPQSVRAGDLIIVLIYHSLFGAIAAWLLVRYGNLQTLK